MDAYYAYREPTPFADKTFGMGLLFAGLPVLLFAFSLFTYYKNSTSLIKGPVFEMGPVIKYGKYAVPAGVVLMVVGVLLGSRPWL